MGNSEKVSNDSYNINEITITARCNVIKTIA